MVYFLALGPHRLDLGDILYAPNAFVDGQGRTLAIPLRLAAVVGKLYVLR